MNLMCKIFGHKFSMTKKEIKNAVMDTFARYMVALIWQQSRGRVDESYVKSEIDEKTESLDVILKKLSKRKIESKCNRCDIKLNAETPPKK